MYYCTFLINNLLRKNNNIKLTPNKCILPARRISKQRQFKVTHNKSQQVYPFTQDMPLFIQGRTFSLPISS